jgi:hypothetical protein
MRDRRRARCPRCPSPARRLPPARVPRPARGRRGPVRRVRRAGAAAKAPASDDAGGALREQLSKQRAMASTLVLTVAAHREIGGLGQCRQDIQQPARFGTAHLGPVAPGELPPAAIIVVKARHPEKRVAWRQVRQPHVVEVARRQIDLANPSGRSADRSNAKALARLAGAAKPDYPNRHCSLREGPRDQHRAAGPTERSTTGRPPHGRVEGSGDRSQRPSTSRETPGSVNFTRATAPVFSRRSAISSLSSTSGETRGVRARPRDPRGRCVSAPPDESAAARPLHTRHLLAARVSATVHRARRRPRTGPSRSTR